MTRTFRLTNSVFTSVTISSSGTGVRVGTGVGDGDDAAAELEDCPSTGAELLKRRARVSASTGKRSSENRFISIRGRAI